MKLFGLARVHDGVKLKSPPRSLPKRDPQKATIPLAPTATLSTLFASGAIVAALLGCRANTDAAATDPAPPIPPPTSEHANEAEKIEEPLRVRAPEAPSAQPVLKGASNVSPVPTSVIVRPGREPIRFAGMMPVHRGDGV